MVGIAAGVIAQHPFGEIGAWEELRIVVLGTLVAAVIIEGIGRFWRWRNRPHLVVIGGDGAGFDRELSITGTDLQDQHLPDNPMVSAYAKVLRVKEARGKATAREARIRIVPDDADIRPLFLKWYNDFAQDSFDVAAGEWVDVVVQVAVRHESGTCRVPMGLHTREGAPLDFVAEARIGDTTVSRQRFRIENGWHSGYDTIPHPVAYPVITLLAPHRSRWTRLSTA